MKIYEQSSADALLGFSDDQAKLELHAIKGDVRHEKAFGRLAIACPGDQVMLASHGFVSFRDINF